MRKQYCESLLAEMTLAEKIGQMTQADYFAVKDHLGDIGAYSLGSLLWGGNSEISDISAKGWAEKTGELQRIAQSSRLRIPLLFGIDAVHGHNNVDGAVIFPHNIGLGATRNPGLVEQVAHATAEELRGTGIPWDFAPCIAVARDERWGRTYESFGEDPELAAQLGTAYVNGLQGTQLSDKAAVLACVKHFVGDGGTTKGKDQGNNECDEAALRALHMPGYREALKHGARSIMVSYNSWNGVKLHGHRYLLTEVLKGELAFEGFLVSDWAAIDQLASDYKSCIEQSINAGLDMIMIPFEPTKKNNYREFITLLIELVQEGKVPVSRIDDAVRRILTVKQEMGLFDDTRIDPSLTDTVGSKGHRMIAREAVRQSLVLLSNKNNLLPLSKHAHRIHVAGSGADNLGMQCGGWTIDWQGRSGKVIAGGTTILEAIHQAVSPRTHVTCSANGTGAEGADVGIVVIGEEPYAEWSGDREDLSLPAADLALILRMKNAGIPVVVVLLSGRCLIATDALKASDAFLAAWLPGTEGQGVADILFGDARPVGKLPHSWPRSMEQIPLNIGDTPYDPLFPYGFGLTYRE
jgi:beta-glucosidase